MDFYLTFEGNYKKQQDTGLVKRLKRELKKLLVLIDIFLRVLEKGA
jgi:hypothetical protein